MITPELRQKLSKIYELVKRGTEGEKVAAERALNRIIESYGLDGLDLESLDKEKRVFTYTSNLEETLFINLLFFFLENGDSIYERTYKNPRYRKIYVDLTYLEYVTISCSYEYFRRHMKSQWSKLCLPLIGRCRTAKGKKNRKNELSKIFIEQYLIKSGLIKPEHISKISSTDLSDKELKDRNRMKELEGGQYNKQMTSGFLLN